MSFVRRNVWKLPDNHETLPWQKPTWLLASTLPAKVFARAFVVSRRDKP
jgi:hypothetical protein